MSSIFSALVGFIMLIISFTWILVDPKNKKPYWWLGAGFIFFVFAFLFSLGAQEDAPYVAQPPVVQQTPIAQQEKREVNPAPPVTREKPAAPTPAVEVEQKDEPEQQTGTRIIPGIFAADITHSLKDRIGMEFTGARQVFEKMPGSDIGFLNDGEVTCSITGITYTCNIQGVSPLDVVYASFTADSSMATGTLADDLHLDAAKAYLGFSATVPYEGSDPDKARAWVEENIGSFHEDAPGTPIKMSIGAVEFELAGTKYLKILTLRAIQNEAIQ